MTRRGRIVFVAALAGWASIAWVHLYCFSLPWADTWCYLGPAAAAPAPLHLVAPFLGSFNHSDAVWALHLPGAPLLYSLIWGWGLPFHPAAGVSLFVGLWALIAVATASVVITLGGRGDWAAAAGLATLAARGFFDVALGARPELLAALLVLLLWVSLCERTCLGVRAREVLLGGCSLLGPWLHPVTLVIGAAVAGALGLLAFREPGRFRRLACIAMLSLVGSLVGLGAWFTLQPGALDQFRDHAHARFSGFGFGRHLWAALATEYGPGFAGHVLWILGLSWAAVSLVRFRRADPGSCADQAWGGWILLAALVGQEFFQNELYLSIAYPVCAVLLALGASQLEAQTLKPLQRLALRYGGAGLIALTGAFWISRTHKFWAAERPSLRAELQQVANELDPERVKIIPDVLWEQFLAAKYSGKHAVTLPQASSPALRQRYETYAFSAVVAGDLVVVDRLQTIPPLRPFPANEWQAVAHYAHLLPGRKEWGYDLTVYRKLPDRSGR